MGSGSRKRRFNNNNKPLCIGSGLLTDWQNGSFSSPPSTAPNPKNPRNLNPNPNPNPSSGKSLKGSQSKGSASNARSRSNPFCYKYPTVDLQEKKMYKNRLQELCQKKYRAMPKYTLDKVGPDHNPRFTASVVVNGVSVEMTQSSSSSKEAQSEAARLAFEQFTTPEPLSLKDPSAVTMASGQGT